MMKNKLFACILAIALVLSLASCGSQAAAPTATLSGSEADAATASTVPETASPSPSAAPTVAPAPSAETLAAASAEPERAAYQAALDTQAVENIMNRHVYYHCYGLHEEEMEQIWVQEPENQATASFGNNNGYWVGYDNIWTAYVDAHLDAWKESARSYCEKNNIEVTDEELEKYYGVSQLLMHCTTTGVIEVAEDGLTARGVWYSPGMICESGSSASWIWEKYAVDFVNENGQWKMWHLHMYTDFMCSFGDSFTSSTGMGGGMGGGAPSGNPPSGGTAPGGATESGTASGGAAAPQGEGGESGKASKIQQITDANYSTWSAGRLLADMLPPEIPLPYDSFSFDSTYGPSVEQYQSLGIDVQQWYDWAKGQ